MNRFARPALVACVGVVTATLMLAGGRSIAAGPQDEVQADKKRAALWEALEKALPKEHERIDVYAENASLTAVVFRSKGITLRFSLKAGKVEEVQHMKVLGHINRITFEGVKGGGAWVLWQNGNRELTFTDGEK